MKIWIRIGILVFGLLSLAAFALSISQVRKLVVLGTLGEETAASFHFSLYLPGNKDSFFDDILLGAETAADELDAVLSVHSIEPEDAELEMAVYTGVDGIIVCPYLDDETALAQLQKIAEKEIPFVLINHNILSDMPPWPYVGTNNFEVGQKMGMIIDRVATDRPQVAVVYSEKSPGISAERELVEMGINSVIADRLYGSIVGVKTSMNPLAAEEVLYQLFRDSPQIDTIVFTDSSDTLAAGQALIDLNLVGKILVVGFGDEPGILEFIDKGIIAGTITVHPERTGYEAVKSLHNLCTTGYTSTSIDTGIEMIVGRAP